MAGAKRGRGGEGDREGEGENSPPYFPSSLSPTAFRRYRIKDLWRLRPLESFIVITVINFL